MRVLVLAPHTDDGEFGCGGAIGRYLLDGHEVYYVAFSAAEKSVPKGMDTNILRTEVVDATKLLGVPSDNLEVLDFEVRDFPACRQEILEEMIRLQAQLDPDIVFLPSTADTHQDHQTISAEGFRAFKKTTMLGYELPWNNLNFTTSMFVVLQAEQIDCKIRALAAYRSQAGKSYATPEFVRNLAMIRGTQIGVEYAEAFETIRWVMR